MKKSLRMGDTLYVSQGYMMLLEQPRWPVPIQTFCVDDMMRYVISGHPDDEVPKHQFTEGKLNNNHSSTYRYKLIMEDNRPLSCSRTRQHLDMWSSAYLNITSDIGDDETTLYSSKQYSIFWAISFKSSTCLKRGSYIITAPIKKYSCSKN